MKVRVDFWKESGKWYETEMVEWLKDGELIHDQFKASLKAHLRENGRFRLSDMRATCLEPDHTHSHPISTIVNLNGSWDGDLPNVMPRVNGKSFRCDCGCNVFKEISPKKFKCNSCSSIWSGE